MAASFSAYSRAGGRSVNRRPSDTMKTSENFAHGIAQRDGAAMRAAHGAIGRGERAEQPLHFVLVELHVHFDRRAAGDGRRDTAPEIVERQLAHLALRDLENLE